MTQKQTFPVSISHTADSMRSMPSEMETLKARLKTTWMAGDYGHFAKYLEPGALEFMTRLNIAPGMDVLDVACGAGQLAIPSARAGARVTGIDIATNSIEQARARAQSEGLQIQFDEGDAEMLPYEDQSFDLVVSLIGAMFAPRPELVAAELLRVTRPGGRIVMANWTPAGFVGQMFKIIGKHSPPSPLMPSPLKWGDEDVVRERLSAGTTAIQLAKRLYPIDYPFSPREVAEFYREYYGPINRAFAGLDADKQAALRHDLEQLWTEHNQTNHGVARYAYEYLEVAATRA
jgi:ubiquinone/menaquinone biosynthesis C-methylase UbiE